MHHLYISHRCILNLLSSLLLVVFNVVPRLLVTTTKYPSQTLFESRDKRDVFRLFTLLSSCTTFTTHFSTLIIRLDYSACRRPQRLRYRRDAYLPTRITGTRAQRVLTPAPCSTGNTDTETELVATAQLNHDSLQTRTIQYGEFRILQGNDNGE
jgi:hypothetical protein